jgi:glyoxylase-like metal-dependent hydrolase (beta-lactamase superfamily II)
MVRHAENLLMNTGVRPAGIYHFQLGNFHCFAISDESGSPVPTTMYGFEQSPEEVAHLFRDHALDPATSPMQVTPLLVDTGQHLVLIDSGFGRMTGPGQSAGKLHRHLQAAGIDLGDIDLVLLSHIHPDHIGGLFTENGERAFPRARYLVGATEWDFWQAGPTLEHIPMPPMFRQQQIKHAQYTMPRIQPHPELFVDGQEVVPGFTAIATPGHTPGHMAFLLSSANEQLLITGDAWTHPVVTPQRPAWKFIVDVDHEASYQSKMKLLQLAEERQCLVHAYHFPWPGLGHIVQRGTHRAWEPIEYHWGA